MKLNSAEIEKLYQEIELRTGTSQTGNFRKESLLNNVENRIRSLGLQSLKHYFEVLASSDKEMQQFISLITIHTTSWFREPSHMMTLKGLLESSEFSHKKISMLSVGCSTGQEAYTFAMVAEKMRQKNSIQDYNILALDIDPISLEKAKRAIYPTSELSQIPLDYNEFAMPGHGRAEGLFTLDPNIRQRTSFLRQSILEYQCSPMFDFIFCRNVLIYFSKDDCRKIIEKLRNLMLPHGVLMLGHAETSAVEGMQFTLVESSCSCFRFQKRL